MSVFVSKKALQRENKLYQRNNIIMKRTHLPTESKTKRTTCPRCSKRGYSKVLRSCIKCKFVFTPEKEMTFSKAILT